MMNFDIVTITDCYPILGLKGYLFSMPSIAGESVDEMAGAAYHRRLYESMIKRRSLLNALLFAPAIIPSASLMSLSWRSSKLLLPRPPLRHLSANWTIKCDDDGDPEWMIDIEVENEIALILRQEIDRELDRTRSISNLG